MQMTAKVFTWKLAVWFEQGNFNVLGNTKRDRQLSYNYKNKIICLLLFVAAQDAQRIETDFCDLTRPLSNSSLMH